MSLTQGTADQLAASADRLKETEHNLRATRHMIDPGTVSAELYLDALADHRTAIADAFAEYDERPDLSGHLDDLAEAVVEAVCDVDEEADADEGYHFMAELFGDPGLVAAAREGDFINHGKGTFVIKERVTNTRLSEDGGEIGGVIVRAYGIPVDLVHLDRVHPTKDDQITEEDAVQTAARALTDCTCIDVSLAGEVPRTRLARGGTPCPVHANGHDQRCGHETLGQWAARHGYAPPEDIKAVVLLKCHPECEVLARAKAFGSVLATKLGAD
jgi:hypothetical protein